MSCQTLALPVDAVKDRLVDWPSCGVTNVFAKSGNVQVVNIYLRQELFWWYGWTWRDLNVFIHDIKSFEMYHLVYKGYQ